MDIREAARLYTYPKNDSSSVYANHHFHIDQEKKYGKKAWAEACTKARTEYNFGSSAVKW